MTNEQKLKILDDALFRAYEELEAATRAEMDTPQIKTLLENIGAMEWAADRFRCPKAEVIITASEVTGAEPAPANCAEAQNPEPANCAEAQNPEPAKATISKEEVRDKLSTYSNKYDALDVASVMSEMGYSKLSDIPAERYAELIERVEAVIEEYA